MAYLSQGGISDREIKISSGLDDSKRSPQIFIFDEGVIENDDDLIGTDNEQQISDSEREYAALKQEELDDYMKVQDEIDKLIQEKEATELREKLELEKSIQQNQEISEMFR